jgi:hypothetical protein
VGQFEFSPLCSCENVLPVFPKLLTKTNDRFTSDLPTIQKFVADVLTTRAFERSRWQGGLGSTKLWFLDCQPDDLLAFEKNVDVSD